MIALTLPNQRDRSLATVRCAQATPTPRRVASPLPPPCRFAPAPEKRWRTSLHRQAGHAR
ncbi:MAG: DUF2457 domain-containing protein [Leptolinea sp.]|nr:DUF2457 domain-containing protein [Leptolinea sp.]